MRFADLFAAVDLSIFPLIGLLIFVTVFVAVAIRAFRETTKTMTHTARLPLDDGTVRATISTVDQETAR